MASGSSQQHEIIRGRLYYVALNRNPRQTADAHYFSTDNELVYWNFFLDFGPLNLGQLYRFCEKLNQKLSDRRFASKKIYYYSSTHSHRRANSVALMCAYAMLYLGRTPEEAYAPFEDSYPPFPPFHDASPCVCTYKLRILDVLRGIEKARRCKFFDFDTFDCDEYEHFEKVENGDLNWHIQGKLLAFAGPHNTHNSSVEGYFTLTPEDYIPYFRKRNVGIVVRLNKKYYDENRFKRAGIRHGEMYYLDGSTPAEHVWRRVLEMMESEKGAIAIHCKAGLGRAGTMSALYIMKHYGFTAAEAIGWLRVTRPGSIIGPQQHYLASMQQTMWAEGEEYRRKNPGSANAGRGETSVDRVSSEVRGLSISSSTANSSSTEKSQGDFLRSRRSPQNASRH